MLYAKLLEVSQKVARNLSKSYSKKSLFSSFICSVTKMCKLYNNSKISKHFVQFCAITSLAK